MSKPGLKTEAPKGPKQPLPEAFVKAQRPERACGEITLPVFDLYGGPVSEPPKK
ncbi:MAG TPA: hypothetical protein VLD37_01610 [Candidatus Bilamarchaeum sp.]|nr:hypothetical protein [Candidatus Bilamarchaeum sp.]